MEQNDNIIIERLGELRRKQDFTSAMMAETRRTRTMPWVSAAAAVLVLAVIVSVTMMRSPFDGIALPEPDLTEYRGSQASEIQYSIEAGDWLSALEATEAELDSLRPFDAQGLSDDERDYLDALYNTRLEELQWTRIYLLVKLDKRDDIRQASGQYLALDPPAERRDALQRLLEKL